MTACLAALYGLSRRKDSSAVNTPSVSVIVAVRNGEDTIGRLIEDLLAQDYTAEKFDIWAVDDGSTDTTAETASSYAVRDSRVHVIPSSSISPYTHKKRAVHTGILASSGEIVMTVDADCRVGSSWIRGMAGYFHEGVELVAGEIVVEGGGLMAALEILEFTGIQAMSAGLMNAGFPATCNGANLAYRRAAFERVNGYEGVGKVVSGDDDLLMQKIAKGRSSAVVYATGHDTAVHVGANPSLSAFINQRIRWASKIGTYPSRSTVLMLSVFYVFFAALLVWTSLAAAGYACWRPLLLTLSMKIAGDCVLVAFGLAKRRSLRLLALFPLAELLHVPYILYVTPRGFFGRFHWRGRRVGAAG
jgi:cellulose synthase/poly-beta-1,6-N-acetylglucosamine synthase-like glycosyltransferase